MLLILSGVELAEDLERAAIQDEDHWRARDIQEVLPRVVREGDRPRLESRLLVQSDKLLRNELALRREHLDPLVAPIRGVDEPVIGDGDVVYR